MARHEIGLVTSVTEGFPNVVLEMLASGVSRVVSTDCAGGLRAVPGVIVLNTREPRDFAETIIAHQGEGEAQGLRAFLDDRSPSAFFAKIAGAA